MFKKALSYSPHIFVLLFIMVFAAFAWTEPSVAPPGGNAPAPLNTSIDAQSKEGALVLGVNPAVTTGLVVLNGDVGIGETIPSEKLDVAGNIDLNANAIKNVGAIDFSDGTSQTTAADPSGLPGSARGWGYVVEFFGTTCSSIEPGYCSGVFACRPGYNVAQTGYYTNQGHSGVVVPTTQYWYTCLKQ